MKTSKDDLLKTLHTTSEFYGYLHNLHEKTQILSEEIFSKDVQNVKLVELRLSEIYSLLNTAKLFLSLKEDLYHYEITSLLSFCDSTYYQLYVIARDDDQNTSRLDGEFQNFSGQYDIVKRMLENQIDELKTMANL